MLYFQQMFKAQSFPIVCNYDDNGLDIPDGLQADVDQIINKNQFYSSSSDNETEEPEGTSSEMCILRPRPAKRKIRITSDKSYGRHRFCFCLLTFIKPVKPKQPVSNSLRLFRI